MLRHERNAPIWLFSFVDLAFLLLIAFTQVGPAPAPAPEPTPPAIGEIEIPRLETAALPMSGGGDEATWQLRVHPTNTSAAATTGVFELVEAGRRGRRIDAEGLASRLDRLHDRRVPRPILAPHRDSRSEDLLIAVGLLETVWTGARTVVVRPGPARVSEPRDPRADAPR